MSGRDVAYASALDCVESHAPEERSPQPRSTSKGSLSFWPAPAPAPKSSSSEKKALDSPAHNPLPRQPPGLMQRLKEALFSPHPHRFSPAFGISEIATKLQTQRSSQPQPIPSVLVNLGLPGTDISPHSRPRAAASSLTEADLRNPVLTAIVSRSHLADEKDEISLQMGDTVQVFKLFDDGWCYGARIQAVGQTSTAALIKPGMFPVSCLGQLRP
ncbi:uncharacterized protein BJ171DRAFT_577488 [Polychytrium aggregatum]|uniref:uncharacterized protein n=1 Tax=Polychytrium aggregatum TaxID=110093 RepID=UPI0022FF3064|nr:uncharacterized protein BJ171DRAFT_577488 [Polychytrium aggregatum]KAI9209139.1 hypothetical protein BJ171DRAFT_577488 [Polychytrium aggregatum]